MADYYDMYPKRSITPENMRRQLEMQSFWGSNISLARLSTSTKLTLRNFKMNSQNRLSSSSRTQCEIDDKVTISSLDTFVAIPKVIRPDNTPQNNGTVYFHEEAAGATELVPFTHLSK